MSFEDKINGDIKTAMLAKDSKKLEVLRAIKNVVIILKTSPEGISDDAIMKSIQKEVKKRKESADIFKQQNRADLAEVELYQASVMEEYLPKQMGEDEIKAELVKIIAQVGASSAADMGKVMGAASKAFAGKADNKIVSQLVKDLLSK
ncbi:MAG TPA: GatB/YqeY domain-containing protein [Bacteroidia bacterium]|nr:GatB/YqeY domain-containing protein [Bacteroidia bacterium]HRD39573.1 GatB/YqeY domain-containing protein [Bacteroidia bacterium]